MAISICPNWQNICPIWKKDLLKMKKNIFVESLKFSDFFPLSSHFSVQCICANFEVYLLELKKKMYLSSHLSCQILSAAPHFPLVPLANIFLQMAKFICPNLQYICPNIEIYLSKLQKKYLCRVTWVFRFYPLPPHFPPTCPTC